MIKQGTLGIVESMRESINEKDMKIGELHCRLYDRAQEIEILHRKINIMAEALQRLGGDQQALDFEI